MTEETVRQLLAAKLEPAWQQVSAEGPRYARRAEHGLVHHVGFGVLSREGGAVSLTPTLGVQHTESTDLVAELLGLGRRGVAGSSTVGIGLADLMAQEGVPHPATRWFAASVDDAETVVMRARDDLEVYGEPYYRSLRTLGDVVGLLSEGTRHQAQEGHLAVAAALAGETQRAEDALGRYTAEAVTQSGPMLEQSRRFVRGFLDRFGWDRGPYEHLVGVG